MTMTTTTTTTTTLLLALAGAVALVAAGARSAPSPTPGGMQPAPSPTPGGMAPSPTPGGMQPAPSPTPGGMAPSPTPGGMVPSPPTPAPPGPQCATRYRGKTRNADSEMRVYPRHFPTAYNRTSSCEYTYAASIGDGARYARFFFYELDLAPTDTVDVYTGSNWRNTMPIATYSNASIGWPTPLAPKYTLLTGSDGGALTIVFNVASDNAQGRLGFMASVEAYRNECDGPDAKLYRKELGQLHDGSGPLLDYQPFANCTWNLYNSDAQPHYWLLRFTQFETEQAFGSIDAVSISYWNQPDISYGVLSGTPSSLPWPPSCPLITHYDTDIVFNTLGSKPGWNLQYVPMSWPCAKLQKTFFDTEDQPVEEYSFTMTKFTYSRNSSCFFFFNIRRISDTYTSAFLTLQPLIDNLRPGLDTVELYNGPTVQHHAAVRFTGLAPGKLASPIVVRPLTTSFMLRLNVSDDPAPFPGTTSALLRLSTTVSEHACPAPADDHVVTERTGLITDGTGNNLNYELGRDCGWTLRPSGTVTHLQLVMYHFSVETTWDKLTIYDGANSSAPQLQRLSGPQSGMLNFNSTSPVVYVLLDVDDARCFSDCDEEKGFALGFTACDGDTCAYQGNLANAYESSHVTYDFTPDPALVCPLSHADFDQRFAARPTVPSDLTHPTFAPTTPPPTPLGMTPVPTDSPVPAPPSPSPVPPNTPTTSPTTSPSPAPTIKVNAPSRSPTASPTPSGPTPPPCPPGLASCPCKDLPGGGRGCDTRGFACDANNKCTQPDCPVGRVPCECRPASHTMGACDAPNECRTGAQGTEVCLPVPCAGTLGCPCDPAATPSTCGDNLVCGAQSRRCEQEPCNPGALSCPCKKSQPAGGGEPTLSCDDAGAVCDEGVCLRPEGCELGARGCKCRPQADPAAPGTPQPRCESRLRCARATSTESYCVLDECTPGEHSCPCKDAEPRCAAGANLVCTETNQCFEPECRKGAPVCPCKDDGSCDAPYECDPTLQVCIVFKATCPLGDAGCPCRADGSCNGEGLDCASNGRCALVKACPMLGQLDCPCRPDGGCNHPMTFCDTKTMKCEVIVVVDPGKNMTLPPTPEPAASPTLPPTGANPIAGLSTPVLAAAIAAPIVLLLLVLAIVLVICCTLSRRRNRAPSDSQLSYATHGTAELNRGGGGGDFGGRRRTASDARRHRSSSRGGGSSRRNTASRNDAAALSFY